MNSFTELLKAFAEVLKGVAWPLVIFLVLLRFRKEIKSILDRLSHFKYKDVEASFEVRELLDEAEEHVEGFRLKTGGAEFLIGAGEIPEEYKSLQEVVRISPRAAVIAAWAEVERSITSLWAVAGVLAKHKTSSNLVLRRLIDKEIASPALLDLHSSLRIVRNRAVYDTNFDMAEDEAERYLSIALQLAAQLQMLRKEVGDPDDDTPQASET